MSQSWRFSPSPAGVHVLYSESIEPQAAAPSEETAVIIEPSWQLPEYTSPGRPLWPAEAALLERHDLERSLLEAALGSARAALSGTSYPDQWPATEPPQRPDRAEEMLRLLQAETPEAGEARGADQGKDCG